MKSRQLAGSRPSAKERRRALTLAPAVLIRAFSAGIASAQSTRPGSLGCYALTVAANPPDGGTARALTPPNCPGGYRGGTQVGVSATPASGFAFASWSASGEDVRNPASPLTTLLVTGAATLDANFARTPRAPAAHFVVSPASPRAGESVVLTDTSSGFPTSWSWDVDDDGHLDALGRSATVVFDTPGVHAVRLIVANASGTSSTTVQLGVLAAPPGLDAVDPNPELLEPDGTITQDPARVAAAETTVVGATADGATRLVFRYFAPGAGRVTFALAGGSPANDGGFLASGSGEPAASITVPVSQVDGGFLAFAVYLVPPDFNLPSGWESSHDRPLGVTATFNAPGGAGTGPAPVPIALTLYRPPIVLLHGLWSDNSVWTMPLIDLPYLDVPAPFADYRATNADSFSVNLLVPKLAVDQVVAWERSRQVAATRADFIAHSMGGVLARQWIASSAYVSPTNFNAGDIHKLITLDSPHLGAHSADTAAHIRDTVIVGRVFSAAMSLAGMPVGDGAVDDLEFFSPAIDSIGLAEVGSHALAGVGGSSFEGFCPGLTGTFIKILAFFSDESVPEMLTTIFGDEANDVVVGLDSENGFLPSDATSTPIPGTDGVHFCVTSSSVYTDAIVGLLNTPVTSSAFQFFPPVITSSAGGVSSPAHPAVAAAATASTLAIQPIVGGPVPVPGGSLHARIQASPDIRRVLVFGNGDAVELSGPPFAINIPIPATAAGPLVLAAVGADRQGGFALSEPLAIDVVPDAALQSIAVRPASLSLLRGGPPAQLEIDGTFADGVVRRITALPGAEFVTSDASVATVSPSGAVTAVGAGSATVTVFDGSGSVDVPVTVLPGASRGCRRCPRILPPR